jgi:hypothetical protein
MNFTNQTITILVPPHAAKKEIEVLVGDGSGLGYYESTDGIVITTTNSGYAVAQLGHFTTIFNLGLAHDEQVAQRFIEIITPLLDWSKSKSEIVEEAEAKGGVRSALSRAFKDACEQIQVSQTLSPTI